MCWNSETASGFKIYPNPATQELFIETENVSEKTALFKVYDAFGRLVKAYPLESKAKQKVDISNIPTGMYSVQLELDNAQYFEHLWIQK
ncbi:MAG: T9SS C-terminal target domain-containing protein [Flavobacteriia bacterium]|nr:T9SS C-terminal target domain-containing protein [Flavobacteriia bacterium]